MIVAVIALLLQKSVAEVRKRGGSISAFNRELSAFMVERLRHGRLIRLSGTEKAEADAVYRLSQRYSDETMGQKLASMRMALLPEPIAAGVAYLMLFVGGQYFGLSLKSSAFSQSFSFA